MDDITIRAACPGDARAIARLDVETWRTTYAGILTGEYLVSLSEQRREEGWARVIAREPRDVRVALDGEGRIVGFGSCGACRGEPGFTGEVFTLYVEPDRQNQGIGRRLLLSLFARLVAQGHSNAVLFVLQDNPGRFFYQRVGGIQVRRRFLTVGGKQIEAAGYGWRDLPSFLLVREERPSG